MTKIRNPVLRESLNRIISAIKPSKDLIKEFILNDTFLESNKFSLKDHEYQEVLLDEISTARFDFVCYKVAQAGISEVAYRVLLSFVYHNPGYTTALVLPSADMVSEVIRLRLTQMVNTSEKLLSIKDTNIDSSKLKRFLNDSIIYGLSGSGLAKTSTINRKIRCLCIDEVDRIDLDIVSGLAARQRHVKDDLKQKLMYSTPTVENYGIHAELQECGHILESLLKCVHCNKEFFPDFFKHLKIKGYSNSLEELTLKKAASQKLEIDSATLVCPKCRKSVPHGYPYTNWVNVATNSHLPRRGMKIGAFDMPAFVTPAGLVKAYLAASDKEDFKQQFLGIASSGKTSSLNVGNITFSNHNPYGVNIFGLDIGKVSTMVVGAVTDNQKLYIHHIEFIPVQRLRERVAEITREFGTVAGVVDYLPYTETVKYFIDTIPNTWASIYDNTAKVSTELFRLKVREDDVIGRIQQVNIKMTSAFDLFSEKIADKTILYRTSEYDKTLKEQLSVMMRIKDYRVNSMSTSYRWIKPNKIVGNESASTDDHLHHASIYAMIAQRLVSKSAVIDNLAISSLLSTFRVKNL